jgi:hypothetical protein
MQKLKLQKPVKNCKGQKRRLPIKVTKFASIEETTTQTQGINTMNNAIYTIAERPNGSKGQFVPIHGLPLMTLAQARAALEAATVKGQAEFVIVNTQAQ